MGVSEGQFWEIGGLYDHSVLLPVRPVVYMTIINRRI